MDTKNAKSSSVLHCILKTAKSDYPQLLKLPEDMKTVKKMKRWSFIELANAIKNFDNSLKTLEKQVWKDF